MDRRRKEREREGEEINGLIDSPTDEWIDGQIMDGPNGGRVGGREKEMGLPLYEISYSRLEILSEISDLNLWRLV